MALLASGSGDTVNSGAADPQMTAPDDSAFPLVILAFVVATFVVLAVLYGKKAPKSPCRKRRHHK